jgi:transcription elongation factor GreB
MSVFSSAHPESRRTDRAGITNRILIKTFLNYIPKDMRNSPNIAGMICPPITAMIYPLTTGFGCSLPLNFQSGPLFIYLGKSYSTYSMSRGFVKEDDQEEIPMVPPRADLPEGVTNYVTQAGMNELLAEKQALITEKSKLDSSGENEKRIALNHINAKLKLLDHRIATAQVVKPNLQARDEIRFGAVITLRIAANNSIQRFQIVGVDEADISKGKIAFTSPLAKALIHKKTGEKAVLKRGREELVFEILDITY